MPLGVISDDDFAKEVNNSNVIIVEKPSRGRDEGDKNVPDFLRAIISNTAIEDSSKEANKLAASFGISKSSVSAYKHGNTSTDSYNTPDAKLLTSNNAVRDKIIKRGKSKILAAMQHITNEKLEHTSAKELSGIAKDMSVVVKNMEPPVTVENNNNLAVNFVMYAPEVRKLESYDIIDVNE